MNKIINGKIVEITEKELEKIEKKNKLAEEEYWANTDYEELVNNEIRKKYSISQEFAILRQKDDKQEEYKEYYNYCEECKEYVKSKKKGTN